MGLGLFGEVRSNPMRRLTTLFIAIMIMTTASAQYKAPQIIAHRGFHASEGAAKNSLNALKAAQDAGFWGSECDINLSKDDELLVIHGDWHPAKNTSPKVHVQRATKAEIQAIPLTSGEVVPTLDEYLSQLRTSVGTKLIIELKNHATPERETELVERVLAKVKEYGVENEVEYIAFRPFVCSELARLAPSGTKISYLCSDYPPLRCKALGCTGIDYNIMVLKVMPQWIRQAHELGMTVNAWTVNSEKDIRWCIEHGIDYITTDNPILARKIVEEMCR